jgi:starch phosphorylase
VVTENITKVLYPNGEPVQGKQLRLEQQYFFVCCSLQDMISMHLHTGGSLENFHGAFAVQLNDTHPSIGVAELMRLLVDEHQIDWEVAWDITRKTFAYTNHTLLAEALEKWPIKLFGSLLQLANKQDLAGYIQKQTGVMVDPDAIFDVQVKRLHEYKRQHLHVLHIITLYNRIKHDRNVEVVPRTFIFGGKAAPGYFMAKLIIKLINSVAEVLDKDPDVRDRLKVVFLPNYNAKQSRWIYPAADLSEQISTAAYEASGTSNMKFAMNGTLTIGTLDGANIEIRDAVGHENFFLFGLTAEEVRAKRAAGYHPWDYYQSDAHLREAVDLISSGHFSHGDTTLFKPLVDSLIKYDPYLLFADYESYVECQEQVSYTYKDKDSWTRKSILNAVRMGKFSSDRAVREYCDEIWKAKPVKVELNEPFQDEAV